MIINLDRVVKVSCDNVRWHSSHFERHLVHDRTSTPTGKCSNSWNSVQGPGHHQTGTRRLSQSNADKVRYNLRIRLSEGPNSASLSMGVTIKFRFRDRFERRNWLQCLDDQSRVANEKSSSYYYQPSPSQCKYARTNRVSTILDESKFSPVAKRRRSVANLVNSALSKIKSKNSVLSKIKKRVSLG